MFIPVVNLRKLFWSFCGFFFALPLRLGNFGNSGEIGTQAEP